MESKYCIEMNNQQFVYTFLLHSKAGCNFFLSSTYNMSGNPLLKFLDPPMYSVILCIAGARKCFCVDKIKAVHDNKFNLNY